MSRAERCNSHGPCQKELLRNTLMAAERMIPSFCVALEEHSRKSLALVTECGIYITARDCAASAARCSSHDWPKSQAPFRSHTGSCGAMSSPHSFLPRISPHASSPRWISRCSALPSNSTASSTTRGPTQARPGQGRAGQFCVRGFNATGSESRCHEENWAVWHPRTPVLYRPRTPFRFRLRPHGIKYAATRVTADTAERLRQRHGATPVAYLARRR